MVYFKEVNLFSEIINQKKQFIFEVEQSIDSVFPNQLYKYQIYIKNVSGTTIEDVKIQVANPNTIIIDEPDSIPYIEIGDMKDGESKLLFLSSRCTTLGEHSVHFICYGGTSGMFYKTLKIYCTYDKYIPELEHKIHIYNFTPYEDAYRLESEHYNNKVTQLFKKQKLPYQATQQPFNMSTIDTDEHQSFLDQNDILKNTNEHVYQYLSRENYTINLLEEHIGSNLFKLIQKINETSQYVRLQLLRTGTNELKNEFKEFESDGFIHKFGLLNSEIFHHVGVIPTYTYMSDYLFRWAPSSENQLLNLYPPVKAMNWNTKVWNGHVFQVFEYSYDEKTGTDKRKFLCSFEDKKNAETYVKRTKRYNELENIEGYTYEIKERFWDTGVFFINIPLKDIPSNFFLLDNSEINALIQKTKPYGTKFLVRYIINTTFDHNLEFYINKTYKPMIKLDLGDYEKIIYFIQSLKYHEVEETDKCGNTLKSTRLIPDGLSAYNGCNWNYDFSYYSYYPHPTIKDVSDNNQALELTYTPDYTLTYQKNPSSLTRIKDIESLLFNYDYSTISFKEVIPLDAIKRIIGQGAEVNNEGHKLWINTLKETDNDHHVTFGISPITDKNLSEVETNGYILNDGTNKDRFDLFRVIIPELLRDIPNLEFGISIKDSIGKLHGLSIEYDEYLEKYYIKYVTSLNDNYILRKNGYVDAKSIGLKILKHDKLNLLDTIVMYFEPNNETENVEFNYFNHIIISRPSEISVFIRNATNQTYMIDWSSITQYSKPLNNKIEFQTPQFIESAEYETYNIIPTTNGNDWTNLYRIDKKETSYAYIRNDTNDILSVNDICLHFGNLNIPETATIKGIYLKTIMESNVLKTIQCRSSIQNNYLISSAEMNKATFEPNKIEGFHQLGDDYDGINFKLTESTVNENSKMIEYWNEKLIENVMFNDALDLSLDYLSDDSEFLEILKPYWVQVSDFCSKAYDFNDFNSFIFVIEGYNSGSTIDMIVQCEDYIDLCDTTTVKVESGYFRKKVQVPYKTRFRLDETKIRFRFDKNNNSIKIFNTYLDVDFKTKKEEELIYTQSDIINSEDKKLININVMNYDEKAYKLNNGLTVNLNFEDLDPGELYKIYSTELIVLYQDTESDILVNNAFNNIDTEYTSVIGDKTDDTYMSGKFFDDVATIAQLKTSMRAGDEGFVLEDKLYQSFTARSDNITSITIFPNGFRGNPSSVLKLGIYENNGTTPGTLIKEVYVNGWTKSNAELKDLDEIKYNINVENLIPDKIYWFKMEVVNPVKNNYYLLKYNSGSLQGYKLLYEDNKNLKNAFSSLVFKVNSSNIVNSFNNLPAIQNYFTNPFVRIGLHKGQGNISNLKIIKNKGVKYDTES